MRSRALDHMLIVGALLWIPKFAAYAGALRALHAAWAASAINARKLRSIALSCCVWSFERRAHASCARTNEIGSELRDCTSLAGCL